ncbi:hypothetical protein [Flammeovirga agarivorans]|uniref:Uncharacterized protein n=1 Tax=Flammeovirga agarivorans TaxID=2726742 RepID=A0A7X8SNG0_9BACT|nr:hypothetical protein [Flammeovirga agarivorans]NLR93434.1 hypothetical protein [Flammeovirga agarivorans]
MKQFRLSLFILSCLFFFVGCTKEDQEQVEDLIPELSPVYEVYQGEEKIMTVTLEDILNPTEQEDWEVIQLVYGDTLTFKDVTTEGDPTGRSWALNGNGDGVTSTENEVSVIYNVEGEYAAGEVTFIREGSDYPDASIQTEIPLKVSVVVPELLPAFKVMLGETVVYELKEGETIPENKEEWATVEFEQGGELSFINTTNGDLYTSTYWLMEGAEEDSTKGNEAMIQFNTAGEYADHQIVIERKEGMYPDLTVNVIVPVVVKVTEPVEEGPAPLTAGVKVYLSTDLENAIYTIDAGNEGSSEKIAIENGTSLVFMAEVEEGIELLWAVNNGSEQTSSASSFEVAFEEDNASLTPHTLTLSKEGHDTEEVEIPLTIEVFTTEDLQVAFTVYKNEDMSNAVHSLALGEEEVANVLELEEGDKLTFVDQSAGEATSRTWTINNGVENVTSQEATFEVEYSAAGSDFGIALMLERKDHEKYEDATLDFTSLAKVNVAEVQNEATEKQGKIMDNGSGVIYFETTHEIAAFTSSEVVNDFTISIENIEANYSNASATISEVKVADNNNKMIEIYLVENFYNSDDITVAYSGNKIQSVLDVPLSTFDAEQVEMNGVMSYLDEEMSDFELIKSDEEPLSPLGWFISLKNPKEGESIERVTTNSSKGNASMHFKFDLSSSSNRAHKFSTSKNVFNFSVEEGEYEISIDIFVPQATSALDIIRTNISTNDDAVDQDVYVNVPWDLSEYPQMKYGEWVTLRQRITMKKIIYGAINMNFKEGDMKLDGLHDFYMDNIQIRKVEARQ